MEQKHFCLGMMRVNLKIQIQKRDLVEPKTLSSGQTLILGSSQCTVPKSKGDSKIPKKGPEAYLIFVIFSPQAQFLGSIFLHAKVLSLIHI